MSEEGPTTDESLRQAEAFKAKGNEAFSQKEYAKAVELYSDALEKIDLGEKDDQVGKLKCVLLTNRSNARFAEGNLEQSVEDAQQAIEIDRTWAKAYFRKGAGLAKLGKREEAMEVYRQAIEHCGDKNTFVSLLDKLSTTTRHHTDKKKMPSLYPEQGKNRGEMEKSQAERNLERLRSKLSEGRIDGDVLLDGLLSKLLVPEKFCQIVYRSREAPKDSSLPASFQDLIANDMYVDALVALFPAIKAKAESVLQNVKEKAAKEGQFMDAQTEAMLRPQVLNEAFAHQIVDMIHEVNRRQNAMLAQAAELLASPDVEEASLDQLSDNALSNLLDDQTSYCILDDYLDDKDGEWQELMLADIQDIVSSGFLEQRDVASSSKRQLLEGDKKVQEEYFGINSCWLSMGQLEANYTALHELVTRICALPHELNKKAPEFKMRKPVGNGVLLVAIGPVYDSGTNDLGNKYEGYPPRRDGMFGNENNGFILTATYHLEMKWEPNCGGELELRKPSGEVVHIEPKADRLVLFRSRTVDNTVRSVCCPSKPRFSITVFLNGPPEEEKNRW